MTDDEISELAECLWDACARYPKAVHPGGTCPLWAMFGSGCGEDLLGRTETDNFIVGFDDRYEFGTARLGVAHPLQELGRRFREQALSGEGFR